MDLSVFDVIKGPRVTTKAYMLNQQQQQLVLEVHPKANKPMVREALRTLFNVEAEAVRITVVKGKVRRRGRYTPFRDPLRKKAVVTLKRGYAINLMEGEQAAEQASVAAESRRES